LIFLTWLVVLYSCNSYHEYTRYFILFFHATFCTLYPQCFANFIRYCLLFVALRNKTRALWHSGAITKKNNIESYLNINQQLWNARVAYSPYPCFNRAVNIGGNQDQIEGIDGKLPMVYRLKAVKKLV